MHRRACLLTLLAAGCDRSARRRTSEPPSTASVTRPPYNALRARIASIRDELAERFAAEPDARRGVVNEARGQLRDAVAEVLIPAWLGTRWSFHGTADEPLAPQGIACGYFVATVLQHASLLLESRRRFGQSTALAIARSLVPPGPSHHRVFSVPSTALERSVLSFGDGVYILGLDVHVGFIVVRSGVARVLHASYLGARVVVEEPITACEAIDRSRGVGYHITSLFADDTLVEAWLNKTTIPLRSA